MISLSSKPGLSPSTTLDRRWFRICFTGVYRSLWWKGASSAAGAMYGVPSVLVLGICACSGSSTPFSLDSMSLPTSSESRSRACFDFGPGPFSVLSILKNRRTQLHVFVSRTIFNSRSTSHVPWNHTACSQPCKDHCCNRAWIMTVIQWRFTVFLVLAP